MYVVNKSQVDLMKGNRGLVTEASDVGLAPGDWPQTIAVLDDRNEGYLFFRGARIDNHGDLGGFNYRTRDGRFALTVFND
ncbi:MAG: hypothetical protein GY769_07895 [bacterium]|nr:hypothetical protein [bacterium]